MRLGGRIVAASEVLTDMSARRRPVADALKDWGLAHRFAGSADRAAIGNLVYDALRKKQSLGWRMGNDSPLALVFAVLLDGWSETAVSLQEKLGDDKFAPKLPSEQTLARFNAAQLSTAPLHIQADIPQWSVPRFEAVFGDRFVAECQAQTARPPVDLRANRILSNRESVLSELPQTIGAVLSTLTTDGIRIPAGGKDYRQPNVQVEPAFQKGWFEIQDEGSQLVAQLSGISANQTVLDFCAGGGGKTLALASQMQNSGQVIATDSDKGRLAPIFERIKRAETRNVQVRSAKSDLSDLVGTMDHVLIDAPCTGAGTWRRRPDAKWRLNESQLGQRVEEQATILEEAKKYVKKGGHLVYVTCSLFEEENAAQIANFTTKNADFTAIAPSELIKSNAVALTSEQVIIDPFGLTLTPLRTQTDGFYLSVLKRK